MNNNEEINFNCYLMSLTMDDLCPASTPHQKFQKKSLSKNVIISK